MGQGSADVRLVEQLVDSCQTRALAQLVRVGAQTAILVQGKPVAKAVDELMALLDREGWRLLAERDYVACGMALPRPQELAAALNRWRA